jgi:hypothetical protein
MRKPWIAWLFAVIVIDLATYLSLCRPELTMARDDPSSYAYLARIRAGAGGIWSLSPRSRCAVHLTATTLAVLAVAGLFSYLARRRKVLPHPPSNPPP